MSARSRLPFDGAPQRPRFYNRAGEPITAEEWATAMKAPAKTVEFTAVAEVWDVSTAWLGLDHDFVGAGPPRIFETLVVERVTREVVLTRRYSTEIEAIAGHEEIVTELRRRLEGVR